jgi:glycosyltransferase involved in cell wall biosynthesis
MKTLHVVPDLHFGGASRALEQVVHALVEAGSTPSIYSVGGGSDLVRRKLETLGAKWSDGSDAADADLVLVHYANTPAMLHFLYDSHPPMRVVVWSQVEGGTRPHVVTRELVDFADAFVAVSSSTLSLPEVKRAPIAAHIPASFNAPRFTARQPLNERPFYVGYLGTVDFVKMHPDFVAMHAAIGDADIRFRVWGFGNAYPTLKAQTHQLRVEHQFEFKGATDDALGAFASMHVCGYPLCEESYGANDLAIQEAMTMGIPCVILDRPGLRDLAIDGVTALVAKSPREYTAAVIRLKRDPAVRKRLGSNAREHVRSHFNGAKNMQRLYQILVDTLSMPKRRRVRSERDFRPGAGLFVASLGHFAGEFGRNLRSLEGDLNQEAHNIEDERAIATARYGLCNPGAGGVLNYRAVYPNDPVLRFWSGLIFSERGSHAVAVAEFLAALRLGLPKARVQPYLAAASGHCGLSQSGLARWTANLNGGSQEQRSK